MPVDYSRWDGLEDSDDENKGQRASSGGENFNADQHTQLELMQLHAAQVQAHQRPRVAANNGQPTQKQVYRESVYVCFAHDQSVTFRDV